MSTQEEHHLGRVLLQAVPDLPEPPDRLAAVGRRVQRRRSRLMTVGTGMAVLLIAAGAAALPQRDGGQIQVPNAPQPTSSPPVPATASAECPPADPPRAVTDEPPAPPAWEAPTQPFVPPGAVGAVLCGYSRGMVQDDKGQILLSERALPPRTPPSPDEMVSALNALTPVEPDLHACHAAIVPRYLVLLTYPDGNVVRVNIDLNCGMAIRDRQVRFGAGELVRQFGGLTQ
jgi:hypothetical protein